MGFRETFVSLAIVAAFALLAGYPAVIMSIGALEDIEQERNREIERHVAPFRMLSEKQAMRLYLLEEENELLREIFSRTGGGRNTKELYRKALLLEPTQEMLALSEDIRKDQLRELNEIYLERASLKLELERARARLTRLGGNE